MIDHERPTNHPIEPLLRDAAPTAFAPGFAGRVHARLRAEREDVLPRALERHFIRIVPLAAAASLLLAAFNWWGARGAASSALDAALNLPPVTVASAYATASLFGSTGATETP